jgi:hypothetical protein
VVATVYKHLGAISGDFILDAEGKPIILVKNPSGFGGGASIPVPTLVDRRFVAFTWDAQGGRPKVIVDQAVEQTASTTDPLLLALTSAGALAIVGGFVLWRRTKAAPGPTGETSAIETMMRLAELGGAWLERTRRYLLVAGAAAALLWAVVLVQVAHGGHGLTPPAVALLIAMAALTALLAREAVRISRDLREWRGRVEGLHALQETIVGADAPEP